MIPGYGLAHLADTALTNVQLFGGRYPIVQTVTFSTASAWLSVLAGVAGSVGGVSAVPIAGVRTAADPAVADEPAPGCWPESARPGKPSHEPSVIPMPAVSTNASASSSTGTRRSPRSPAVRRAAARLRWSP